ncbi:hypothetical protein [Ruminococcus sp.]|uniref:hypothetical protein n=1 Tax=Ruminococcus sp. TaxID=41978 RepID=UPI003966C421
MQKFQTIMIVISLIAVFLLEPTFIFIVGYFGGLILNWIFGSMVVESLNIIFRTDRFATDMLPWLIATVSMFASFFTRHNIDNNDK